MSMAPYMWIKHKWAGDQVKHSPCLFLSLAGSIQRSLSSQRAQFSSTLQSCCTIFINLSEFNDSPHPQVELFLTCDCGFFKVRGGGETLVTHFLHAQTPVFIHTVQTLLQVSLLLENDWRHVGSSMISLNPFLCFLLPSQSRRKESQSASHILHYRINHSLLCNIVMNEINGFFVSDGTWIPHAGLWKIFGALLGGSTLCCMPCRVSRLVSFVGVLCVRHRDSSPYQTCSNSPLSGF